MGLVRLGFFFTVKYCRGPRKRDRAFLSGLFHGKSCRGPGINTTYRKKVSHVASSRLKVAEVTSTEHWPVRLMQTRVAVVGFRTLACGQAGGKPLLLRY
ncbi:hypothetical protein AMTR_s00016p00233010 [Amborella trichopoda]|uniref:Uncharacterized protein n=1 Tax=Amborella trichopoda TaxID=13333 RepID=W1PEE0_AMBTC|nr:hypothetical protein AMTR_s00016p00233010 [Amborella trichopoda]